MKIKKEPIIKFNIETSQEEIGIIYESLRYFVGKQDIKKSTRHLVDKLIKEIEVGIDGNNKNKDS